MSRGALCSYTFLAQIPAAQQSVTISMDALNIPTLPHAGWINRIITKSLDAALTGGNYDVTIWTTDSAVALNRSIYEAYRRTGISVAGGQAVATPDLNDPAEAPYVIAVTGAPGSSPDVQIMIDTGAAEAAQRDFWVSLIVQGDAAPDSPLLARSLNFSNDGF